MKDFSFTAKLPGLFSVMWVKVQSLKMCSTRIRNKLEKTSFLKLLIIPFKLNIVMFDQHSCLGTSFINTLYIYVLYIWNKQERITHAASKAHVQGIPSKRCRKTMTATTSTVQGTNPILRMVPKSRLIAPGSRSNPARVKMITSAILLQSIISSKLIHLITVCFNVTNLWRYIQLTLLVNYWYSIKLYWL